MRVIAGKYRSRPLLSLPGAQLRPTSDRLRETLFNVLAAWRDLAGSVWIDLYAGTGAVGIEALSRGVRQVYFVESSRNAVALIRKNLENLGISAGFELMPGRSQAALRQLANRGIECDICFLDPPYKLAEEYAASLNLLGNSSLLAASGIAIAEHDKHFDPGESFGALQRVRKLVQGDAVLSFYQRVNVENAG